MFFSCKGNLKDSNKVEVSKKASALIKTFKYAKDSELIISVHRGGVGLANYPENYLETIQYLNENISAVFEIDVAKTKDDVLVLMHDNTLDRTTTGTEKLDKYTYQELLTFDLVDDFGNWTKFKIPKFADVLTCAKANNAILTVDIKRSVDVLEVINEIRKY